METLTNSAVAISNDMINTTKSCLNRYLNTTVNMKDTGTDEAFKSSMLTFQKKLGVEMVSSSQSDLMKLFSKYISNTFHDMSLEAYFKNIKFSDGNDILAGVTYNTQRDNKNRPSGSCNVTSQWIQFSYFPEFIAKGYTDDMLWGMCNSSETVDWIKLQMTKNYANWSWLFSGGYVNNKALNEVYSILEKTGQTLCSEIGLKKTYRCESLHYSKIGEKVRLSGAPVVFGANFTGGHIVCCIGQYKNFLVVHDPWGNWNSGYTNTDGAFRLYSLEKLSKICGKTGTVYSLTIN